MKEFASLPRGRWLAAIRYRTHLATLSLGVVAFLLNSLQTIVTGEGTTGEYVVRGFTFACALVLLLRVAIRRAIDRRFEVGGYLAVTAGLVAHYVYALAAYGISAPTILQYGTWLYLVIPYAFFIFRPGRALLISCGTFVSTVVAGVLVLVVATAWSAGEPLFEFLQYTVAGLFLILFSYAVSAWREALVWAQATVELTRELALTDGLTGLPNRRALEEALARELARADRYDASLSVVLLDLDDFKALNDGFGHDAGDAALREVAGLVRGAVRTSDVVGRWGGEEFLAVLPETEPGQAAVLAERIRERLEAHAWEPRRVTASIGVAGYRAGDDDLSLVRRADDALYAAKRAGKNAVRAA